MYAKHPEIAKRWEKETPHDHKLPEHVGEGDGSDYSMQSIAKDRLAKMKKHKS
jgi:hypothetical protein